MFSTGGGRFTIDDHELIRTLVALAQAHVAVAGLFPTAEASPSHVPTNEVVDYNLDA